MNYLKRKREDEVKRGRLNTIGNFGTLGTFLLPSYRKTVMRTYRTKELSQKISPNTLDLEYQNKLNAIKNHPDITDEKSRKRMIDNLEKKYKTKGADLNIKDTNIKNNFIQASARPIATVAGTGLAIKALTNLVGNRKNERNTTNYIKGALGLGLIGYGTLTGKKLI